MTGNIIPFPQAFSAIKGFLGKLEKVSEDPSLAEQMGECSLSQISVLKNTLHSVKHALFMRKG